MKTKYYSYSLWVALYPDTRRDDMKNWYVEFEYLRAEEILGLALAFKFKKERIEKLINHSSKKFTYIKKKGTEIIKHFHNEPPEYRSSNDPRQPLNIEVKKIIEEHKKNPMKW